MEERRNNYFNNNRKEVEKEGLIIWKERRSGSVNPRKPRKPSRWNSNSGHIKFKNSKIGKSIQVFVRNHYIQQLIKVKVNK